jgi:16S rRNA (guanine966-N2)-methyltransferase
MTDRMRESLFSSIGHLIPGARVLDLYAGSGSMGLEALSRGAESAVFVERDRRALNALRTNIDALDIGGAVSASDVDTFLGRGRGEYDVAFVDPPYAVPLASVVETVGKLSSLLAQGAVVVVHRRLGEDWPAQIEDLALVDQRRFGGAELWRYEKEQ